MNNPARLWLLTENITTNAENSAGSMDFGSVLVSFLYFLGALLLIYLILVLVSRWGKKSLKQDKDNYDSDKASTEKALEKTPDKQAERKTDNKGDSNG